LIHPFDLAVPGTLPMTSRSAVQAAVLTAAALQCEIASMSRFERKHYHYADLPFGYQVTQQRWPIARNGTLTNSKAIAVGIDRIQLEQDTGKTTNTTVKENGESVTKSLVDFNRAGCALVEIVMNPDLRSSKHAADTVETLRQLLKHIGTCNGRMEEGSLRVDLNVSVRPILHKNNDDDNNDKFQPNLNNRVEVKNLNSLKQVQQAAEYEAVRQAQLLSENAQLTFQETRTYNVKSGKTVLIRTKQGEEDYRFMPEPDLPPVVLNEQVRGQTV
jgi:aspartyl-tRNA(Asn)/glutamyl-tRNA(Gln) amidotransferase subunit B